MKQFTNISIEEWDQIDAYLSGEMNPQDADSFSRRLANDPILAEKVKGAKLLMTGIQEVSVRNMLNSFRGKNESKAPVVPLNKSKRYFWLAAAAASVVMALAAVFLFQSDREEKLYSDFFEADPGLATAMSSSEDYALNRGMIDYKTGRYKEAIDIWRPLVANRPGNDTLHYFTGISFLALKQSDSAVHHLHLVAAQPQSSFKSDASWYLALALLQQEKRTEAVSILDQSNHPRKNELLSRIK